MTWLSFIPDAWLHIADGVLARMGTWGIGGRVTIANHIWQRDELERRTAEAREYFQ